MALVPITPAELPAKHERAAIALAAGLRQRDVADLVGVDVRTIRRWQRTPEFRELVRRYRASNTLELARQLDAQQLDAAETLRDLMDERQPPNVRLGAARTVIESAARLREKTELKGRGDFCRNGVFSPGANWPFHSLVTRLPFDRSS
jgi:hypothetical protein